MPVIHELETERLLLRQWQEEDFAPFAQMSQDAEVMRFFPGTLDAQKSQAMAQRCHALIAERGWGFWATQEKASGQFIGMIGLNIPMADLPFSPCVEIGWRLARPAWGKGLATEGARAALRFAFDELALPEVVAFTTLQNQPSQRVMQRLGMQQDGQTFLHPAVPAGHFLQEHCLYRLANPG